ncbi:NADPH-ferredoxin reductase FprA [Mycolicibacterium tokaiense]|uniref:NADPH-ferredoxin reductase FprA n=2 Tax=Mycolicibacterium TaxID=1866885 RepID=A0A378TLN5_9MYCO|nr:NADPH-ferredoxin reductase FprA [Mycolicibacterium tokaiense]
MDGVEMNATYVTGWIKRGPVGLIGHTKSDAAETISNLLTDLPGIRPPEISDPDAILAHLASTGVDFTTWQEWERLDAHEMSLGQGSGRERIKVVAREDMVRAGRVA